MNECLAYFRRATTDPLSVEPWPEWWAIHHERVESLFSLVDYVRLKHRGLLGAQQILDRLDRDVPPTQELPKLPDEPKLNS